MWQTDERQATITAGNICGQGYHLTLGSLCGTKRARPVSHSGRGPEVWLQPTPKSGAGSFQGWLVRNGRLAVGLTAFDGKLDPAGFLGAAATHSYNDPVGNGDCPLAGDEYLPFSYPDQNQTLEGANAFLLYEHDSADDLGQQVPSRAWLSLAKLVDCGVKTFSPGDSGGPTTSSGVWSGGGYEPSDPPARWSATTTLEWTMKLHRVGCKGFDG